MRTTTKTEFKQWQVLPALCRPPGDGSAATSLPECRASESTEPSLARPGRAERLPHSGRMGDVQALGKPPENSSTPRVSQRP